MADSTGNPARGLAAAPGPQAANGGTTFADEPPAAEAVLVFEASTETVEASAAESPRSTAEPALDGIPAAPPSPSQHAARRRHAMATQLLDMMARVPYEFDFFQFLRRLECAYRDRPRLGESVKASDEPIRLGQEPSTIFAPAPLSALRPGRAGGLPWLLINFMGLLGPNGPLPLHLTEYTRERLRNTGDPTFARFLDLFHHRMLLFFYRAWARGQPTVSHDRPEDSRFLTYLGSIVGLAMPAFRDRDAFPHVAKLFYGGRLGNQARNAEGLAAMIGDFFGMPARIEQFVGSWLKLPPENRWLLGRRQPASLLGLSSTLGEHAWGRQQKFRVVLGPLDKAQFRRMLPGGASLPRLKALVRNYIGDEMRWDLRLFHEDRVDEPLHLGRSHLGWTTWLGRAAAGRREELVLDPQSDSIKKAA